MKILSVNCGSSTLKFSLFNMETEAVIASGNFERINFGSSFYTIKLNGEKIKEEIDLPNHKVAAEILLDKLVSLGIINSLEEIEGVGHRIVHGGSKYSESVLITDEVVEDIKELYSLAPLHNPAGVLGIEAFRNVLPNTPMSVVFDTAYHQTMEEVNYLYAVPYKWYRDYKVRKYGAHGTSHRYVNLKLQEELNRNDLKVIICHLGSGASLSAIDSGKVVDTSMGFTPLAGVVMGTRSGDIDPSIIPYVMNKESKSADEIVDDLNKKSGLLGLSEMSNDMRDLEDAAAEGNEKALLARKKFVRRVVDYIAMYYFLLKGADAIAFTAGIGENDIPIRLEIVEELRFLGIIVDVEKNNMRGQFKKVSTDSSTVDIYVVPTDEELMIARDTKALIR